MDPRWRQPAWLMGRDHVTPDDVRAVAHNVLRHGLQLSHEANAAGVTSDRVVAEVVRAHCVAALSTDLMPTAGKDASAALAEARALLAEETNPGAVVFLTDGFESGDRPAVEAARKQGIEVLALAVGPSPGLAPVSDLVDVVGLTVDDRDVDRIARQIGASSGATTETERAERRKDFGLYLLYPIVALALFGFRRGFAVRRRMPCGARCASGRRTPV